MWRLEQRITGNIEIWMVGPFSIHYRLWYDGGRYEDFRLRTPRSIETQQYGSCRLSRLRRTCAGSAKESGRTRHLADLFRCAQLRRDRRWQDGGYACD